MTCLLAAWHRFLDWIRGAPARPLPPIVHVDNDGVGWTREPGWQEATAPDVGQHDSWKRDMRIFLWRATHGLPETPGSLNLRDLGLGNRQESVPFLYPVGQQLAEVCRRLGFRPLAVAAMPEIGETDLRATYARQEAAVLQEAHRRFETNEKTRKERASTGQEFVFDSIEDTVALLTVGPFEGPLARSPLSPLPLLDSSHESAAKFTAIRGGRG